MLFVSHDRHFLAALSNRVLGADAGRRAHYGGGYTEYVGAYGLRGSGPAELSALCTAAIPNMTAAMSRRGNAYGEVNRAAGTPVTEGTFPMGARHARPQPEYQVMNKLVLGLALSTLLVSAPALAKSDASAS